MNTSIPIYSSSALFNSLKPALEPVDALNQVLASAMEEMRDIQSESLAAAFTESMLSVSPMFGPRGTPQSVWQIPAWFQSQAKRMVQSTLSSFGVVSRSQQQILELMGASLSQTAQQTAKAISEVNGTFASRRVSAEVIDFSDRRAQAASKAADEAEVQHREHQRANRKAAG